MARIRPDRSGRARGRLSQPAWRDVVNDLAPTEVLSVDQVEAIHDASLRLLRDTGMRVLDPGARDRLRAAGCSVTDDRARFDPEMVIETIVTAPASFTLRARNPAWGIRALEEVVGLAQANGFAAPVVIEMPANNLSLVFRKD